MAKSAEELLIYLFDEILPKHGMNLRVKQKELSLEMLRALQENKLALCEAEVGTGKICREKRMPTSYWNWQGWGSNCADCCGRCNRQFCCYAFCGLYCSFQGWGMYESDGKMKRL